MGWGPVEWVGESSQKPNLKNNALLKTVFGDQLTGWGEVPPEAKFEERKCTSFFSYFSFERPLLRYLFKTVLHCKGSRISATAITEVLYYTSIIARV